MSDKTGNAMNETNIYSLVTSVEDLGGNTLYARHTPPLQRVADFDPAASLKAPLGPNGGRGGFGGPTH